LNVTAAVRRPWVYYAASLWAIIFAAPHTWWALGWPVGFPGGPENYHRWMTSWWRYLYDVVVVLLSFIAVGVALGLLRAGDRARSRRLLRIMAWIAGAMLSFRGVAGLIVDGRADPIWWPLFLTGGLLFVSVAWLSRVR
jgi:hypothetical protein